jgi:hypothetical protein
MEDYTYCTGSQGPQRTVVFDDDDELQEISILATAHILRKVLI